MNLLLLILTGFLLVTGSFDQPADDVLILQNLLEEFLEGASINDRQVHNRFWADDLIYTSAAGERISKADIMNGLPENVDSAEAENLPLYSAREVKINLYGGTAVVAFRLVAEVPQENGEMEELHFYNTGTFVKQDGQWRAVSWQATTISR
jgi:hypothetical protein